MKRKQKPIIRIQKQVIRKRFPKKPVNRKECLNTIRPCPFVSCRYNLSIDVFNGKRIKEYESDMEYSCALDAADYTGGMTLKEISNYLNLSRERVRQIIFESLRKIRFTKLND